LDRQTDPIAKSIRSDLYTVLSSGEVTAQIDDGTGPHRLNPIEINHDATQIDIQNNRISLGRFPGSWWTCMVNSHELERFLDKHAPTRSDPTSMNKACLDWFVEQMRDGRPKKRKKSDYCKEAGHRFKLSQRRVRFLWAQARAETRSDWNKPGRPKSSQ
jgi:hypothetical protein